MASIGPLALPSDDLCHIQWRGAAYTLERGPLTLESAMDYFSLSPFYDRQSTNEVYRMQFQFQAQRPPEKGSLEEQEALKNFVGREFVLLRTGREEEGLFVIQKRMRTSATEAFPIATYYIIRDDIYQSPSLHAVLSDRILTSLHALRSLLELAQKARPAFDPRTGYAWKIREDAKPSGQSSGKETGARTAAEQDGNSDPMDVDGLPVINGLPPSDPGVKLPGTSGPAEEATETFNPLLFRAVEATIAARLAANPAKAAPSVGPETSAAGPAVALQPTAGVTDEPPNGQTWGQAASSPPGQGIPVTGRKQSAKAGSAAGDVAGQAHGQGQGKPQIPAKRKLARAE